MFLTHGAVNVVIKHSMKTYLNDEFPAGSRKGGTIGNRKEAGEWSRVRDVSGNLRW